MKEENKKNTREEHGVVSTSGRKSWLSAVFGGDKVPDDDLQLKRRKVLKSISGEKGDLSFAGNKKIQSVDQSVQKKSWLAWLLGSKISQDRSSDVNETKTESQTTKQPPLQKESLLDFSSHPSSRMSDAVIGRPMDRVGGTQKKEDASFGKKIEKIVADQVSEKIFVKPAKKAGFDLFDIFKRKKTTENKASRDDIVSIKDKSKARETQVVPEIADKPEKEATLGQDGADNFLAKIEKTEVEAEVRAEPKKKPEKDRKIEEIEVKHGESGPEILKSNLIKEEIVYFFDWKRNIMIMLFFISFLFIGLGLAYWVFNVEYSQNKVSLSDARDNCSKYQTDMISMEKEMASELLFKKRMALSSELLDEHVYWSNFFDLLERDTIADVFFTSFSGDTNGGYSIAAIADKYENIDELIRVLKSDPEVISADVSMARQENSGVAFELNLVLNREIFFKKDGKE